MLCARSFKIGRRFTSPSNIYLFFCGCSLRTFSSPPGIEPMPLGNGSDADQRLNPLSYVTHIYFTTLSVHYITIFIAQLRWTTPPFIIINDTQWIFSYNVNYIKLTRDHQRRAEAPVLRILAAAAEQQQQQVEMH
jgi:hypothetical protein